MLARKAYSLLKELIRDERGVNEIVSEALLLTSTVALFFILIVEPIKGIASFLDSLIEAASESGSKLLDALSNGLKNIWNWLSGG